ncbi:phage integrase central domain-containing protein [Flaviflexus salsibiostraticola]|uniref:phage integrase central domain-containing protein n=1 Tax=Flaviflexus salsibiostraticola TaxID=1282737 RepID=UPI003CCC7296
MRVSQVRQDGYSADRSAITTWIIPTIGHVRLERLTAAHVRQVINAVLAKRAASTAVRAHSVLRQCLKAALAEGHTVPPSVFAVPPPKLGERGVCGFRTPALGQDLRRELLQAIVPAPRPSI